MNYEFEDYRPRDPKDPGPWSTWIVPREFVWTYVTRLLFWCVLLPILLFGVILSPAGFFLQILVIDYFSWLKYKQVGSL